MLSVGKLLGKMSRGCSRSESGPVKSITWTELEEDEDSPSIEVVVKGSGSEA